MMQVPRISVIIPLYNKAQYIGRAVRSALAQSIPSSEIIVVDDGSTDGGPRLVAAIKDPRVRLVHQDNHGVSVARNRGIAQARAGLVAFLDADDEWMTTFLETVLRLQGRFPEAEVFGTGYVYVYDDGRWRLPRINAVSDASWEGILDDYFRIAATSDPPLWTSAVAVTKKAIRAVGGFEVGVTSGEDLLAWARLAVRYPIAYSAQHLSLYHLGKNRTPAMLQRRPDQRDVVGVELRKLLTGVPPERRRELRRYIGMWDKMQASKLLQQRDTRASLRHSAAAVRCRPLEWKLYIYILLGLLPSRIAQWAFVQMLRATESRRLRQAGRRPIVWPVAIEVPGSESRL
jgi:hypothetical protein